MITSLGLTSASAVWVPWDDPIGEGKEPVCRADQGFQVRRAMHHLSRNGVPQS